MNIFSEEEIHFFMREALKQCEESLKAEEVPVGCVFVENETKQIIVKAHNLTNISKNAANHCEINCIKKLEEIFGDDNMKNQFLEEFKLDKNKYKKVVDLTSNCSLFVSCEPCIMCAYALSLIQIKNVYFGCLNDKFGGNGSILSLHKGPGKSYESFGGYLKEEAIEVLRKFYSRGNAKAPENKRQRKLVPDKE